MRVVADRRALGVVAIAVAAGLIASGFLATRGDARAASASVATASGATRFTPNVVTVNVGDQVTFTYGGTSFHNATSVTGAWTAIPLTSSATSGTTGAFSTPGTYYYYCSIHSDASSATESHVAADDAMVGKIVVQAAATATATTPAATATTPAATATTPAATPTPTATLPPPSNAPCKLTVADVTVGGNTKELIILFAQQARAGYVAIHEASAAGGPGAVIGFSGLLAAGSQNTNLNVALDRALKDGERVWAMLHTEDSGNAQYDGAAIDKPTVDASCGNASVGNIVTFPVKVTASVAPPAVGTGVEPGDTDRTPLIAMAAVLTVLVLGGGAAVAARRARG